jgi:putrescine---pyruvate transaminase
MVPWTKDSTHDLRAKDRAHVLHPFTDLSVLKTVDATVIAESDGAYIYDSDGQRYLDGLGGLWCVNIGYGRTEMVEAIAEQARRLPYYSSFDDLTNPPSAELAAKLANLAPGSLRHVLFGTGGSTATDTAIRIVHHYFNRLGQSNKKHVISREHAYHGSTYLAASLTGPAYHAGWDVETTFVHHIPAPYTYRRPAGMTVEEFCDVKVAELESRILELGPENVSCFIAEPIMGAGGVIVAPDGYQRRTWEICRRYGVLYISDEVVTAFGRLGHMFASEALFGVTPDILCCAKGITSGYLPLGATLISEQIYEVISEPGGKFFHGFTYSGHPVAAAAANKNIEILEREQICAAVRKNGPYFEAALQGLRNLPLVGDVRGSHFMMCIESVANRETKALLPDEVNVAKRIWAHCQRRGLLVRPLGHLNVLSPPLILERSQIDTIAVILRESIEATADDLTRERLWMQNQSSPSVTAC